jgi:hypothetical protein
MAPKLRFYAYRESWGTWSELRPSDEPPKGQNYGFIHRRRPNRDLGTLGEALKSVLPTTPFIPKFTTNPDGLVESHKYDGLWMYTSSKVPLTHRSVWREFCSWWTWDWNKMVFPLAICLGREAQVIVAKRPNLQEARQARMERSKVQRSGPLHLFLIWLYDGNVFDLGGGNYKEQLKRIENLCVGEEYEPEHDQMGLEQIQKVFGI